jgi:NitT/TauT family transport system permease protein
MKRLRQVTPSLIVITLLLAGWWIVVVLTESVIFPTPWEVVTGTVELI